MVALVILMIIVLLLAVRFFLQIEEHQRRIVKQKYLRSEQLLPRHYKDFTQIENKLLAATPEQNRSENWPNRKMRTPSEEFRMVSDYVRGLREDFLRADWLLGHFVIHSPNIKTSLRWESERISMEASYYRWYARVWFDLKTSVVVPNHLHQLTQMVATIAFRARMRLTLFERARSLEFVEAILRKC